MQKISGLICLVVGGLLIYWGYNMSQAAVGKINTFFNGSPGDKPMLCYVAGAVIKGRGFGLLGDLIIGVIGAVLGGWIFGMLGIFPGAGLLGALITAFVGAVILLLLLGLVGGKKS